MGSRLDLHEKFCLALGSRNVYFQAPPNKQMTYPAIRYSLSKIQVKYGDNRKYNGMKAYEVILIHKNPDNSIVDTLMAFPYTTFLNHYCSDNLNHYTFIIYY